MYGCPIISRRPWLYMYGRQLQRYRNILDVASEPIDPTNSYMVISLQYLAARYRVRQQ